MKFMPCRRSCTAKQSSAFSPGCGPCPAPAQSGSGCLLIDTFGTGVLPDEELAKIVSEVFDLTPAGIIEMLDLRRPIYRQTAAYGHFGRTDIDLPWEHTDRTEILREKAHL